MSRILENITEAVGGTPLVRLNHLDQNLPGNVAVKLEFYNPANSVAADPISRHWHRHRRWL